MSPATVGLSRVHLESEQQTDWTSLVATQDKRHTLASVSEHYANLLRKSLTSIRQIEALQNVTYVLDTDLVRNLVENRFANPWTGKEADSFLAHKGVQYALPWGAFLEISHWFRSLSPASADWLGLIETPLKPGNRKSLAHRLAAMSGVSYSEKETSDAIIDRAVKAIGRNSYIAERLLTLLTRDNFRGIVRGQNLEDVQRIFRILSQAPRRPKQGSSSASDDEDRAQKDFHDAINLAIVFQSVRAFKSGLASPESPCYILVTNTFVLQNLPRWVHAELSDASPVLSELLGVSTPVVDGMYPVLNPRDAFAVEQARQYGSDKIVASVTERKQAFDGLSDLLRNWEPNSSLYRFEGCLHHLRRVYFDQGALFAALDRERAIDALQQFAESRQTSASQAELTELRRMHEQVRAFFKILQALQDRLNQEVPAPYNVSLEAIAQGDDFDTPQVQSILITSAHSGEPLLEGELYRMEDDLTPRAYVLRWCTPFAERDFFDSLGAVLRPIVRPESNVPRSEFNVRRLLGLSEEWSEGLILYTSYGVFGCALSQLPSEWHWRGLTFQLMTHAVETAIRRELLLATGKDVETVAASQEESNAAPLPIVIRAVRVATHFGDFQIELDPSFGNSLPVISVLTRRRIPDQIAFLCERTHPTGIFSLRLSESLRPITDLFPEFQPDRSAM
jgi:hypothetical protein